MTHLLQMSLVLAFPALVVLGALKDLTSYTIPNWISLALLALFPVAALGVGLSLPSIGLHLAVGFAALLLGMAMFALNWIGGGDAKLFAAAALWFGWPESLPFLMYTGLAGGAFTFLILGLRSPWLRPAVVTGPAWFTRLAEPEEGIPYGVAIALGALAVFPASALLKAAVAL